MSQFPDVRRCYLAFSSLDLSVDRLAIDSNVAVTLSTTMTGGLLREVQSSSAPLANVIATLSANRLAPRSRCRRNGFAFEYLVNIKTSAAMMAADSSEKRQTCTVKYQILGLSSLNVKTWKNSSRWFVDMN